MNSKVKDIRQRLQNSELYQNILLLISGNGLAQIIPLAVYPVLTRLFVPDDFGVLAFLFSIHSIILIISTARLDVAIILPRKDSDATSLFNSGLSIAIAISLLIPVFAFLTGRYFINNENYAKIDNWVYLLSLTVFFTAYALLIKGWCTRKKLFKTIIFYTLSLSLLTTGLKLLFGFLKIDQGLLAAFVLAQVLASVLLFIRIRIPENRSPIIRFFSKIDFRVIANYANFPKYNLPHALINTISSNLPVLILTFYFSEYITGQYAVAYALLFKPVHLYAGSVSQALSQKVVEIKHNKLQIWPVIRKYIIRTFFMALLPVGIILAFAPVLFSFVLGEEWLEAGKICRLILPWPIAVLFAGSLSFIPNIFGKQLKSMMADIVYICLRLGALIIGVLTNNVYLGLGLFAVSGFLVLGFILLWYRQIILESDRQSGF